MADLFEEIDARLAIGIAYDRWKRRLPWRLLPAYLRQRVFGMMHGRFGA